VPEGLSANETFESTRFTNQKTTSFQQSELENQAKIKGA
jgi:hypothetical protein